MHLEYRVHRTQLLARWPAELIELAPRTIEDLSERICKMSHHLKAVSTMPGWTDRFEVDKLNQPLCALVLTIALIGCGSPTSRDVLAYDTCITRHPQEAALCEGPRQAYQLDPAAFQARAAAPANSPADSSYEGRSAVAQPALNPVPSRPGPTGSDRNG
jgi:hypothetical protein